MYVLIQIAYRDIVIMKHDSMIIQIVKDKNKTCYLFKQKKKDYLVCHKNQWMVMKGFGMNCHYTCHYDRRLLSGNLLFNICRNTRGKHLSKLSLIKPKFLKNYISKVHLPKLLPQTLRFLQHFFLEKRFSLVSIQLIELFLI